MTYRSSLPLVVIAAPLLAAMALGCSGSDSGSPSANKTNAAYQQEVVTGMHDSLVADIAVLVEASATLGQQAPAGAWDQARDQAAISSMKDTWARARTAYEHIEGAIAPLFPSWTARSTPATTINWGGQRKRRQSLRRRRDHGAPRRRADPVVGQHSRGSGDVREGPPRLPASSLPGDRPRGGRLQEQAVRPSRGRRKNSAGAVDAAEDRPRGLVRRARFADERAAREGQQGVELRRRIPLFAADDARHSRQPGGDDQDLPSLSTLAETKENTTDPQKDGKTVDAAIESGFAKVATLYGMTTGDAIPQPPSTWSSEHPSTDDLATPFGVLYQGVSEIVDPNKEGSVVFEMNSAATILEFPGFKEDAP